MTNFFVVEGLMTKKYTFKFEWIK